MARTRETTSESGAKTGVTRMFASAGTPSSVTDPCLATLAVAGSSRTILTLAPSRVISTVATAVTAWSGEETGVAARFTATGIVRGDMVIAAGDSTEAVFGAG